MKKTIFILAIFVMSFSVSSEPITKQSFIGKWCGKWDDIYSLCLTIDNIEEGSTAKYKWLEHENGKFKKTTKIIKRINRNTLKIENIYLVLNEKKSDQADAFGIFKRQSRTAVLTKED